MHQRIASLIIATLLFGCSTNSEPRAAQDDRVALAVVFTGNWYWLGNSDYESSTSPDQVYGAFHHLATALDEAAAELPRASELAIVAYGSPGAETRVLRELGPINAKPSGALGHQIDYRDNLGGDLVRGIQLGFDELARSTAPRKVLVVIGDGNDSDRDHGRERLVELRRLAGDRGISTFGVVLPLEFESTNMLDVWSANVSRVARATDLSVALRAIARQLAKPAPSVGNVQASSK